VGAGVGVVRARVWGVIAVGVGGLGGGDGVGVGVEVGVGVVEGLARRGLDKCSLGK
jgi:hypothetical protein